MQSTPDADGIGPRNVDVVGDIGADVFGDDREHDDGAAHRGGGRGHAGGAVGVGHDASSD